MDFLMHSIRTFLADLRATVRAHPLRAFAVLALISSVIFIPPHLAADLGGLFFPNIRHPGVVAEIGIFRANAIIGFGLSAIVAYLLVLWALSYDKKFWTLILLVIALILTIRMLTS